MSDLTFKARVPVIDANVGVGHKKDQRYPFDSPEELVQELERHGVERALVYACQGETLSALHGNKSLSAWTSNGSLIPQFVAMPDSESLDHLAVLRADGVLTSVRLHSTEDSRLPFTSWIYGDLLSWLSDEGIPLWVSLADTPPTEIVDTLRSFPDLKVVLLGAHYSHSLMVRPLLRTLPQASLELSRYENIGGVEKLVNEFGAERLIYGSFFPRFAMGPMLYALHRLAIDDDALVAICAGNLERILKT